MIDEEKPNTIQTYLSHVGIITKEQTIPFFKDLLNKTTISVCGQKGMGKTYLTAVIYILLRTMNRRVVYIDTVGAAGKLIQANTIKVLCSYDDADLINKLNVLYSKGSFIIDLSNLTRDELVGVMDLICVWILRKGDCAFIVDEIADYCHQSGGKYSYELERVYRNGRNFGIQPVILTTQRTQVVSKNLLALSDAYLFFRLMHNLDRQKVKDLLGVDNQEWGFIESNLLKLHRGMCLVVDEKFNLNILYVPEIV